ncbi:hypothetical protein [Pseudoalteromonas spongiae]|uniref:hypothetical protein n=1 Tax=Pseudoalteromonas spongiae TaxID=298657 RepID=UPI000C2D2DFA|nr:hypothetical protein [Pseudoalteromonas spongiae]
MKFKFLTLFLFVSTVPVQASAKISYLDCKVNLPDSFTTTRDGESVSLVDAYYQSVRVLDPNDDFFKSELVIRDEFTKEGFHYQLSEVPQHSSDKTYYMPIVILLKSQEALTLINPKETLFTNQFAECLGHSLTQSIVVSLKNYEQAWKIKNNKK